MRVRLYKCGNLQAGVVHRIDEFPVKFAFDPIGNLQICSSEQAVCLIEDLGGELFVHAHDENCRVCINDIEIESGPLLPGDHLQVGKESFLVSYEQTASQFLCSTKVRILN